MLPTCRRNNRLSGNIPNGLGLPSTLETLDLVGCA